MRVADTVAALAVALLGATAIALARQMPYMAEYGPGGGFLPFWLGVALVVLSGFLLRGALSKPAPADTALQAEGEGPAAFAQFAPGAFVPWLVFVASTVAVSLLFERLGLVLAIGLFMLVTMRWVAQLTWPITVAFAVLTPIALYLVFVRLLMVPLPLRPAGF